MIALTGRIVHLAQCCCTLMKCITRTKDVPSCRIFMQEFEAVTRVQDHSWVRHIGRGSFGTLLCPIPTLLSVGVRVVNFSLVRNMCRLINYRPYQ
jgi:hypothetical protein